MLRKTNIGLALCLASILLIAGCSGTPSLSSNGTLPNDGTSSSTVNNQQQAPSNLNNSQPAAATMRLTTYQATRDGLHLGAEIHTVPKNDHPAQTALELLTAGTSNPELISVIPPDTKVLGLKIKDHVAYANFNAAIVKNNPGGSDNEMLLVAAIVDTLTEFPGIQEVQILVDGKKIDTLSGHMDLSEPLSRSEEIIKNK
ncbi:sporulation and spore germination [Lucifera butyrica]|uniref:Sporulation and spore germination n=1 Tax=Lucifera butyrica TaxID=1351585 RepID=A0A498R8W7_9FIRM|nr:GerMN domain-containing protein [Lucifera butyrica]VBB07821.1 sporulation and spore germination [Lucifera butyrica]